MQIKNIHPTMGLLQIKVRFYCLVAAQIYCCATAHTPSGTLFGWLISKCNPFMAGGH